MKVLGGVAFVGGVDISRWGPDPLPNYGEILHEVVTSDRLKSDILRFLKNLIRALGAQKGPKCPKMARNYKK